MQTKPILFSGNTCKYQYTYVDGVFTLFENNVQGASFSIGDKAEYDSYNLSYIGEITKITDKTVTIVAYRGTVNEKTHRLDLYKFAWRNIRFNLAAKQKENSEWYD